MRVSRHTDGSGLAAHPRAATPGHSPRCSGRYPCTRQQPHRRSCSRGASTGSDAHALDLGVQEDVLVFASRHTDESLLAAHQQGQRCLRTRPRSSRGYHGTRSRHTHESVLAAPPRAATPAHSTWVFKRMSSHPLAGTPMNLLWRRVHGQRCPRTRPRWSRGGPCSRQRAHR